MLRYFICFNYGNTQLNIHNIRGVYSIVYTYDSFVIFVYFFTEVLWLYFTPAVGSLITMLSLEMLSFF